MEIKKRRKELKLSQSALAVLVGVSLTTIQLWERGVTTPSDENLTKLKQALQIKG